MSHFIPNTEKDREEMLRKIGVSSFKEILKDIPEEAFFKGKLNLPEPLSELEVEEEIKKFAEQNRSDLKVFAGGGLYDHFIPAVIDQILLRSEFYTSYTPYQAEVSQGTLQTMFEYQSMICELTGMEVANASMYDGASAIAEAALMALRVRHDRDKILVASNINPFYKEVLLTYLHGQNTPIEFVKTGKDGALDLKDLKEKIDSDVAGFIFQHPNFLGVLEDPFEISDIVKKVDAILIASVNPISLGILEPPGAYGADIVVGEGQPLGLPLSFGGPLLGIFASKMEYIRSMPGRISGMTEDVEGRRGFVMTLQTREQHIRRERATSNICSNQQLCATAAAIYMSLLGKEGIKEVAEQSLYKAHYLKELLDGIVEFPYSGPFFNEFVVELPTSAGKIVDNMLKYNILAGIDLAQFDFPENYLLVSVTEKRRMEEIEEYAKTLKEVI